ncbi:MAG TPA: Glu/Leu/Phe/Val dehydrogenase [Pyrinomonadaceae bacterium]|jgi:leucine dehydrogenase
MQINEIGIESEHEQVWCCVEPEIGYRGIIAIHSTALGPAVGGARFWNYETDGQAVEDALRLSRGMTYKNALAGLPLGGGKSVIIGDNRTPERELIFRTHGRFIEALGGRYITAEDVGTGTADMDYILQETCHVAGLAGRSGDPSPVTARGVFRAVQASATYRWGSDNLEGRTVALQGCGHVGYYLAGELHRAGARLVVADIDPARVNQVVAEFGARAVGTEEIYGVEADIFAPCALGGIINDRTVPQFKVEIIAGAANNQLLEARHGDALEARGILYAPDYVANAGGIINGCIELLGWEPARARAKVEAIHDTLLDIYERARAAGIPTYKAADELAEKRLRASQS